MIIDLTNYDYNTKFCVETNLGQNDTTRVMVFNLPKSNEKNFYNHARNYNTFFHGTRKKNFITHIVIGRIREFYLLSI